MTESSLADSQALPARRVPVVLSLFLIAVYPLFSVPVQTSIHALAPRMGLIEARAITEGAVWLYAAIVLGIALLWERRTLASIGLGRLRLSSLGFGVATAIVMMVLGEGAAYVIYSVMHQPQHADAQAAAIVGGSVVYALCLSVRAGVVEELFYRGLAIEQLSVFTGRRWLSALIAAAVFTLMHALRFDWVQLIPIGIVAIVLSVLYLWRHDLWANILAHIAVDSAGLVTLALQAHKAVH
jgi:membrane protease YdiL (CAAX protease family)